jgi:hypothetical protein
MSAIIGVTAAFGAAAGFVISGVCKGLDGFMGHKKTMPSMPASLLIGSLIGGGIAGGVGWLVDDSQEQVDLSSISLQQSQAITLCHENTPSDFKVEAGINADGSIKCNYLKP